MACVRGSCRCGRLLTFDLVVFLHKMGLWEGVGYDYSCYWEIGQLFETEGEYQYASIGRPGERREKVVVRENGRNEETDLGESERIVQ